MAPDHYVRAALNSECAIVASTRRGRNAAINTAAVKLGSFVAAGALDRNEVVARLFDAALACGYIAKDGAMQARASILSGMSAGLRQPRAIPEAKQPSAAPRRPQPAPVMDVVPADTARTARAVAIWNEAGDPRGTIAEAYLRSRGLDLDEDVAGTVLRFHPRCPWRDEDQDRTIFVPAMIAAMRAIDGDALVAVQRTALRPDGTKIGRRYTGIAAGAAVKLDADAEVTMGLHVGEGVETVLAARQFGLRPAWAVGSAGAIAVFPVLPGIESLTILAEHDEANRKATEVCATRWHAAGREVSIIRTVHGNDLNDAWKSKMEVA